MARGLSFSSGEQLVSQVAGRSQRAVLLMLAITCLMGGYVFRLFQLQIVQGQEHRQQAEENRIRLIPLPSKRGNILDRNGELLASNTLSRSLYLWPREQTPAQWQASAEKLSPILDLPADEILAKLEAVGYRSSAPIRISRQLDLQTFVTIAERSGEFPGIEIRGESSRKYPQSSLASHIIGYIGEATEEDLQANPDYPLGTVVGKMGIERSANESLGGGWGQLLVEVNAAGEELQELGFRAAEGGAPVQLTLDARLQKAAEAALKQRRGAVVVLKVDTGEVLAMASWPGFDPNIFTRKMTQKDWQELQSEAQPFLNRALQGYPPGSTFKMVTAAAAIASGKYSPNSRVATSAYITVGGFQFHEHSGGYGVIGFRDALAYSSNTFFYRVGMATGPEGIAEWAQKLGIGGTIDLDLLGLDGGTHGTLPSPEMKRKLFDEPWYAGDTVMMSIGQGLVLVTPLELAVMGATLANGGSRVQPHLLASLTNTPATQPVPTGMTPGTVEVIQEGMAAVVSRGTARVLSDGSIPPAAGKTGTAEVEGQKSHALFVGFAPVDKPEISIAVVVENGGYGGAAAAPVAKEVLQAYFANKKADGASTARSNAKKAQ